MPRRGNIAKRDVLPDPVYSDKVVTKLINQVMLDGKKGIAQGIVYDAFTAASEKIGQDPKEVFVQALNNIMPMVEVKARRVGGANYQVPIEIRAERRQTLDPMERLQFLCMPALCEKRLPAVTPKEQIGGQP